jgi:hypothetical protein
MMACELIGTLRCLSYLAGRRTAEPRTKYDASRRQIGAKLPSN